MPWVSKKQARWGHTAGVREMGAAKVKEFDKATTAKYGKGWHGLVARRIAKARKAGSKRPQGRSKR